MYEIYEICSRIMEHSALHLSSYEQLAHSDWLIGSFAYCSLQAMLRYQLRNDTLCRPKMCVCVYVCYLLVCVSSNVVHLSILYLPHPQPTHHHRPHSCRIICRPDKRNQRNELVKLARVVSSTADHMPFTMHHIDSVQIAVFLILVANTLANPQQ